MSKIEDIDIRYTVGGYKCRATVQDNGPGVTKFAVAQVWYKGKWRRPFFVAPLHKEKAVSREISSKAYELVAAAVAAVEKPVKA